MSPVIRQLVSLRLVLFCFSSLISLVGLSQPSISIVSGHPSSDCEEINTKIEINYDNAACIETSWRCSFTENGFETGDDFWCGNVTGSGSNGYITEPVDFKVRHALAPFVSGVKTTSTGEYWIRVEQDCHPNPTVYSEKIKLEIGPTLPSFDFSWSSKIICSGESFSNDLLNVTAATEYDWTAEVVGGSFDEVADGNIGTFSGLSFSESLTNSSNVDGHIKYTFTPKNAYCYNTSGDQVFDVYVDAPLATGTVSLVPYMSYYCEESTFDLEVDGASSDYEIIYQKDSDDADTWHDYAGVLSGITAGFFGETTKFKVRVGSDCENQEYSAEVTMNYQAKPTFDAPNSPDNTITLSRCSSVSVDYQVQTDVSADLSWTVTDNSGFVSGYSTGPSLTNVDSYTIDDVLVNSSDEVQSITYEFTAVKNGCSSSVAKVIVDVQPENKAGTLSVLTPTLCQSAQSQTVTLELDGREGADVDLYIKNPGEASFVFTDWPLGDPTTATWDVFGVSPDNEELTYEFKVKSEATSCITPEDLESNVVTVVLKPVPVLTITAEDGDQNSISSGAVLCHGDEISISPSSNVIGTWFSWSRTVTGGTSNLENDSGVDTNLSINETVHNYGSTDVAVVYTITPIVDPDGANCSGSSQTFEFAIKPNYIAPSGLTATPAITCVSGDVVLNLANPGFGDIVWKRVSYAVRNNAQNSTKPLNEITSFNVVQPDVGNPQQLTINNIFESAYYWVELDVGEGTCIPSEYTSALAALIPEPAEIVGDLKHYNGESGQEPILCWNSSFNQTLPRNNDQATYTWVASVFTFGEGSDAPYAGDPNNIYFSPQGVIGSGIHAIADNVINRNTYPIKIKYSLTPYLSHGGVADQCSGEVKTFEVIVSPLGNAGEFILPVAEVCRDDDFEPSVPDFYVENTSGPYEVQFYPFGAGDWQTWNPLNPVELNENTLFRVKSLTQEIYGCTPETEYSEIVEFRIGIPDDLTDQPPSTQFLPFCGFASLVKIDIPLLGPDAEDWYWQTVVDGRDHSDNSLAKTYQEGETAFIQEYVDGCWGNSHAVNFETLPVPNLINPQDQFRFGTGQVVLSATSDIPSSYVWFEPWESTPFYGEMESQFASAEI
ncbi:MAG: PKD-like domain-containing protein, partial [Cyclobacteriaceae bacterium]